jgi:hypothetical protein
MLKLKNKYDMRRNKSKGNSQKRENDFGFRSYDLITRL